MEKTCVNIIFLSNLDAGDRKVMQALQMKDWLQQQMKEKEAIKQNAKETTKYQILNKNSSYAEQTAAINAMRKAHEDEHNAKRKAMEKAMQDQNLLLVKI